MPNKKKKGYQNKESVQLLTNLYPRPNLTGVSSESSVNLSKLTATPKSTKIRTGKARVRKRLELQIK